MSFISVRRLVQNVNERRSFSDQDKNYLGLEHISSWTGVLVSGVETPPEGLVGVFKKGDILFGKLRPYLAKVAAPEFDGVCSTEALVLRPSRSNDTRFLRYCLSSASFIDRVNSATFGVKMPRASWEIIGSEPIWAPALPVQKGIADFLDGETARIDALIAKKERLVAVLRESLKSELERLITPDMPIHAQMIPFRWVCRITEGQVDPTAPDWEDKPLIAPNHIESRTGRLITIETAKDQGAISGKYAFPSGTVLYSKIRPNLAKACIATVEGMCSADMYPVLPDKRLRPQFLLMQLLSEKFTDWATLESMRVAMPKINRETLGSYRLWVPALDVQDKAAAEFFASQTKTEALSDKVHQSISRLREYRAALITSAVTGQIGVRTQNASIEGQELVERIVAENTLNCEKA